MKKVFIVLIFFLDFVSFAEAYVFTRDLKIGDTGQDVVELQKILNTNTATQVSDVGVGSYGNETTYFGERTKQAVVKFQNLYSLEILSPANLIQGTGFVGLLTRTRLNSLQATVGDIPKSNLVAPKVTNKAELKPIYTQNSINTSKTIVDGTNLFKPTSASELYVNGVSHTYVEPGTTISITGNGFSTTTKIYFGENSIVSPKSYSQNNITVTVPSLSKGSYRIWAKNLLQTTKNKNIYSVVIGKGAKEKPKLTKVTPESVGVDDKITVSGIGFGSTVNVYSSIGIIRDLKVSNGSVSFTANDLLKYMKGVDTSKFLSSGIPFTFSIGTYDSGITSNYGYIILK